MKLYFFLLFLLIIPLASAIDCTGISNQKYCQDIKNSAVSEAEKEYLLSDIISNQKYYPDHTLVNQWNKKQVPKYTPDTTKSQGYIQNAWVKLHAVMPAVLFNKELLIDTQGEILLGGSHGVHVPSHTASGDCQTKRYLVENKGILNSYVDNIKQGTGNLVKYLTSLSHSQKAEIKAEYQIKVTVKRKHYRWKKVYRKRGYDWKCKYSHTSHKTDTLTLEDKLTANIHKPNIKADFKVKDFYGGNYKFDFNFDKTVNSELVFTDSYFKQHDYVFSEVFTKDKFLVVKAEKQSHQEHKNLGFVNNDLLIQNLNGCQIKIFDFFNSKSIACIYPASAPDFEVITNQLVYSEKEKIQGNITPAGRDYTLSYAGKTYQSKGKFELKAKHPYNRITVKYKDRVSYHHIHIQNEKPIGLFFLIGCVGLTNYVMVGFVRKYWGSII